MADFAIRIAGEPITIGMGENTVEARKQATKAETAKSAAEAAAAQAEAVTGPNYANTATGLAATSSGESFAVANGAGTVTIYRNVGGVAVEQRSLYTAPKVEERLSTQKVAYGTNAVVEASVVEADIIRTAGRAAKGDGGDAEYRKAAGAIAHGNKLIDDDLNELEYEGETFKLEHICQPGTLVDQSTQFLKVLDHIDQRGAGIIEISRGNYWAIGTQTQLPPNICFRGPGGFNREDGTGSGFGGVTGIGGFVFVQNGGTWAKSMFKPTGRRVILQGIDFYGNFADAVERDGSGALATVPDLGHAFELPKVDNGGYDFTVRDCRFARFNRAVDNSDACSGMRIYNSVFSLNAYGIYNAVDAMMGFNNFDGNRRNAFYSNGGQWTLFGGLIEFTAWENKSDAFAAVYLGGNTNEGSIIGVQFDRNGGEDIESATSGGNRPSKILIAKNQFKRSGWTPNRKGVARTSADSRSVSINNTDGVTLAGNMVQSSDSYPSGLLGRRSPVSFARFTDTTGIIEDGNNLRHLMGPALDLNGPGLDWYATGTSDEYALIRTGYAVPGGGETNSPWLFMPDTLFVNNAVQGDAGVVGSLGANEWGWTEITIPAADSVTGADEQFFTVVVQHSADPSEIEVKALYTQRKPVDYSSNCSDIQRLGVRDETPLKFTVAAGESETKTLKTRKTTASADSEAFVLRVRTREGSVKSFADFPFLLDMAGAKTGVLVVEGNVTVRAGTHTFAWASGAGNIEIGMLARDVGSAVQVTVNNTTVDDIGVDLELLV